MIAVRVKEEEAVRPPWFVGCCGADPRGVVFPEGVPLVFERPRPVWADHQVRHIAAGGLRLLISGVCAATTREIERLLGRIGTGREGVHALTGLGGSYHVVLDDGMSLTAAGDLAGLRPLFTASHRGLHLFASTPLALAGLVGGEINTDFLAARLLVPDAPELFSRSAAFTGIERVPQDAILRCTPDGTKLIKRPPVVVQPGYDGASGLRDALTAAVAARLSGSVSADLSGGLDSTSLSFIAARLGAQDLRVITHVDPLTCGDEDVEFARTVSDSLGVGEHVFVEGALEALPYAGIEDADPTVFDEPSQEILLAEVARERLAPARDRAVHLGGDGGDVVLTGPPCYLVDLARRHRYRTLIHEAAGLARLRQRPAHTVVRAALRHARSSYRDELLACAAGLERPRQVSVPGWRRPGVEANLAWCRPSPASAWSTPSSARRVAERLRALAPLAPMIDADDAALRLVRRHGDLTRQSQRLASTWGINVHTPFLDDPVLSVCSRVPVSERTTVAALKPLLGKALGGIVPAEVLARRSKGDYSASEYAGLRASGPYLRRLMGEPVLADLGLIEPERVRPVLEAAIAGASSPMGALGDLIASELWLRAEPAKAAYPWKKA